MPTKLSFDPFSLSDELNRTICLENEIYRFPHVERIEHFVVTHLDILRVTSLKNNAEFYKEILEEVSMQGILKKAIQSDSPTKFVVDARITSPRCTDLRLHCASTTLLETLT